MRGGEKEDLMSFTFLSKKLAKSSGKRDESGACTGGWRREQFPRVRCRGSDSGAIEVLLCSGDVRGERTKESLEVCEILLKPGLVPFSLCSSQAPSGCPYLVCKPRRWRTTAGWPGNEGAEII